jgi:lytic murein transglycosylase
MTPKSGNRFSDKIMRKNITMEKQTMRRWVVAGLALLALLPAMTSAQAQSGATCHNGASFERWLEDFKRQAATQGISQRTLAAAAPLMKYDQTIVNKDRGGAVFSQTFLEFSDRMIAKYRVASGTQKLQKQKDMFQRIEQQFGVPGPVLVAFWGLETDFGAGIGSLPTITTVTTLAYDCRRTELFQNQLLAALKIIERGDLTPQQMVGPHAGELGQMQFLPTHYVDYGVDFDGDGRRDLLRSSPDALASAANYLSKVGWQRGQPWLEEVRVPAQMPWDQADLSILLPRSQWAKWGVTYGDGRALPNDGSKASLLLPMGRHGPAFLAYPNFRMFTEWNQSLVYSTTAAYFAIRLAGAPPIHRGNGTVAPFAMAQIRELQGLLARRGHDVGKIDGFLGAKSRAAVKAEQIKLGLPADSYPTPDLVERLRGR